MSDEANTPTSAVQRDRAAGVVIASAAGDALGAPFEFGPPLPADQPLAMTGGGSLGWEPGEWTDDTQQALTILTPLAEGLSGDDLLAAIESRLLAWSDSHPRDVGNQTRAVFALAQRDGLTLTDAAAAHQATRPDAAGNGSLMRTGPVGLAPGGPNAIASLAAAASKLTHPHPDAVDACILWSTATARAIHLPIGAPPDWVDLVADGLPHLDPDHQPIWQERLDACRTTPPERFTKTGWVVTAFQAALAAIAHTEVPADTPPCTHLRLAIERVVRLGDDADTVAAIAGSLLGAFWGATAVPQHWRRPLHGRRTYEKGDPIVGLVDLDQAARLAASGGQTDEHGWPGVDHLVDYYRDRFEAGPPAVELADGVTIGAVHELGDQLDHVDAVVSLCRMGRHDVPDLDHHVIGLIDTKVADNPNLEFVLADTADLIAALVLDDKRVYVHCVQAEHRTPAVATAYLIRHEGMSPQAALDRVDDLLGRRPQPFMIDALHRLA